MTTDKNIFEEAYIKLEEAKKAYDAATTEEEKKHAQTLYDNAGSDLPESRVAQFIARSYVEAKENENDYLDFADVVNPEDAGEIVSLLKENNIKHFTYSSTWSSAVKASWAFQEAGCKLEGLVEINVPTHAFAKQGFDKTPAYLFSL